MILAEKLLASSDIDVRWMNGPFYNLKLLSARTKGKRFEEIASYIFTQKNMIVMSSTSTDYDRIVDGYRFEIKGSTITKDTDDCFSFLQIRPTQEYDYVILETFWFDGTIKFYKISKNDIIKMISSGVFIKQHGGNKAESGTYCYNGNMKPFERYFWFEEKID